MTRAHGWKRVARIGGTTMIALGAVILLFAVYELIGTSIITHGHQSELRKEFAQDVSAPVIGSNTPAPARRSSSPHAIARLLIPKIHLDVIVVEGVQLSRLAYGPGRYPSSAKIGGLGSAAIAGHRTGWGSPFLNVNRLEAGDEIRLETTDGTTYVYRVTSKRVVSPSDGWVLDGDPNSKAPRKLTLTTCDPKFTSRNRLIVWADLLNTVARS